MRKHKSLYKWHKFGEVYVYEGNTGIAVGNKATGYSVFANKKGVQIHRDGKVTYTSDEKFTGTFKKKRQASEFVRMEDKALSKKGEITVIKVSGGPEDIEAFSVGCPKKGGSMLVYQKGDEVGREHELCHYRSGHLTKKGKEGKLSLKDEKEAVKCTVRTFKEKGEYSKDVRDRIIRDFSTYLKNGKGKATKFVKKAEREVVVNAR